MTLPHVTHQRAADEALRRAALDRQAAALLSGAQLPAAARPHTAPTQPALLPLSRIEALRAVWPLRKSVKARPVAAFHQTPTVSRTVQFRYDQTGGALPELRRAGLSSEWLRLLSSVSRTSCAGGRVYGAEGRNLARVVEGLRARCFLKVNEDGRPLAARERVVLVVESKSGSGESFARDLGMSPATFYNALRHPLAHLFLRTQKVQTEDAGGQRRNVATCFTVALFDPPLPGDLEAELYAEGVEIDGVFAVLDYVSKIERTKKNQNQYTKNEVACGKPPMGSASAEKTVQDWENRAAMPGGTQREHGDNGEAGASESVHILRPDLFELAGSMAVQLGEKNPKAARVTYYRALMWLGYAAVRAEYIKVQRMVDKGRDVRNQGAVLTATLNRAARAQTGLNLRDLPFNGPGGAMA